MNQMQLETSLESPGTERGLVRRKVAGVRLLVAWCGALCRLGHMIR